jgi:hypothetical protein
MIKLLRIAILFSLLMTVSAFSADEELTSQDLCPMSTSEFSGINNDEGRKKIRYEEYLLAMTCVKQREESAKSTIAELESAISGLRTEIDNTKQSIKDKWAEMLAYVGVSQDEYDAFVSRLDGFISKVQGFQNQFADDFKAWAAALVDADKEYVEIKGDKIAVFPRLDSKIAQAGQAIEDSKSALEAARAAANSGADTYTVRLIPERRDCLWRIAEYDYVYGDPFRWPEIYSANKDQIKDPDLIYPGQVFTIPR